MLITELMLASLNLHVVNRVSMAYKFMILLNVSVYFVIHFITQWLQ